MIQRTTRAHESCVNLVRRRKFKNEISNFSFDTSAYIFNYRLIGVRAKMKERMVTMIVIFHQNQTLG